MNDINIYSLVDFQKLSSTCTSSKFHLAITRGALDIVSGQIIQHDSGKMILSS